MVELFDFSKYLETIIFSKDNKNDHLTLFLHACMDNGPYIRDVL